MEFRQLRHFVAVAELGSFTRAAGRCGVTQPALSESIAALEKDLRRQLFDRLGRKVTLTEAGRLLLERASAILATAEQTRRDLAEGEASSRLSVGVIPTMAPYLLPGAYRRFITDHPNALLSTREDYTDRLIEAIGEGELDLGIMALPITDERAQSRSLFREELLLAIPAGHPLTKAKRIGLRELVDIPFILLDEMHCLGEQVVSFCSRHAFGPRVVCRGAQLATILELVAEGQGVSLVPQMAIAGDTSPRRVYRSLSGEKPTRTVVAVWNRRRYRSSLVEDFVASLTSSRSIP